MRNARLVSLAAVLALAVPVPVAAVDTYRLDTAHSNIEFKIRHLVSQVTGRFGEFDGTIRFDGAEPVRSSVELTIKAASIDTREPKRDSHLRSPDFFDATKFPEISFKSTGITKGTGGTFEVTGSFTMHGVTKEITVPVEFLGAATDPWGNERLGFSATFPITRKDYGITWNKALDSGGFLLGDEVTATINLEAVKEKPDAKPAGK